MKLKGNLQNPVSYSFSYVLNPNILALLGESLDTAFDILAVELPFISSMSRINVLIKDPRKWFEI